MRMAHARESEKTQGDNCRSGFLGVGERTSIANASAFRGVGVVGVLVERRWTFIKNIKD